jgi:hypothetical protein
MADSTTVPQANDKQRTPETQHEDSQPKETRSSPIKPMLGVIDPHKRDEWSNHIYPHVNTKIDSIEMRKKLRPSRPILAPQPEPMAKSARTGPSTYCEYLNQLSTMVCPKKVCALVIFCDFSSLDSQHPFRIEFRRNETKSLLFHPARTACRPDIVAVRKYPKMREIPVDELHWSHLEATGEEDSGASLEAAEAQAGAYTAYHLQARPDRVFVTGIFVRRTDFKLFLSDPCRVYHTSALTWNSLEGRQLLYAWMWRLYHPEVDLSITIDLKTPRPTFTIKPHDKLIVLRVGESIGRRTTILTRLDGESDTIIKEQFVESGRRFMEGPILEQIHKDGRFPGVVGLKSWEYVTNKKKKVSVKHKGTSRSKTRLILDGKGTPLMDVKTPRELLMGIYDLLESEWLFLLSGFQN